MLTPLTGWLRSLLGKRTPLNDLTTVIVQNPPEWTAEQRYHNSNQHGR